MAPPDSGSPKSEAADAKSKALRPVSIAYADYDRTRPLSDEIGRAHV